MSLLGQVLVLALCFPLVGLLLYVLTVVERWLLSEPRRPAHQPGHERGRRPARQHRAA